MQAHGVLKGLPFLAHTGMWSDVTLFAALMATIVTLYAPQWKIWQWGVALLVGIAVSATMHWGLYVHGSIPEAHVRDGMLTSAGVIHVFYMAIGFAVVILFYTCTTNLTPIIVSWVSVLLGVHVIIGTLVPLKIWAKLAHPVWYPEQLIFDIVTLCTIFGTAVIIWVASLWALR
jgi:hypothetical protein